jgi:electron transfer flavoprotein beta subunit
MADKTTRILVLLREACDPKPPVRLSADGYGVHDRGLRRITNPADLSALEMALQLAAQQRGTVTAVAIGPHRLNDHLRLALAMGADRAVRVWNSAFQGGDAVADARLVARVIEILQPDLVFAGNRLIDRGDDPAPALAAARLGLACVPAALSVSCQAGAVEVLRKSDRGGRQTVATRTPCMLLCDATSCEPRYPTQAAVMNALNGSVEVWGIPELGLPTREVGAAGAVLGKERCSFPRANPQRVVTPDANLPAFERILALLSGGIKPRAGKVHAHSAEKTVEMLLDIFKAEGLIDGSTH